MAIRQIAHSRTAAVVAGATVLVSLGGVSGAFAATQITSHDIKDQTIQKRDIGGDAVGSKEVTDSTLGMRDLNQHTNDKINQPGPRGPEGPRGPKGDPGVADPVTDGPYTTTWEGDNGATLQTATVKCDEGKVAIGGGFSGQGGADDTGTEADKDLQITASYPYTDDYQPVNDRGSFVPNEWVVKGFNNGNTPHIVRPWVTCADVAQTK